MRLKTNVLNSRQLTARILVLFTCSLALIASLGCEPKSQPETALADTPTMETEKVDNIEMSFDKEAADLLKRGLNYLSGLQSFHVTTQQTYEDLLNNTVRIDLETSADLTVSRPDKIRIERYGLESHQIFFFNGKDFSLHNPYDKVYATEKLKGNIEDMFHTVRDTFGISASAADLIYVNSYSLLVENVKGAKVIGKEMIGEVMCDHLLFVRPNVTYQIWISDSEPFLPYKYVVTDTSTSHLLSFSTLMTKWDLSPKINDAMFQYDPSDDTHQIFFMKMTEAVQQSVD
jgi:hypothetical protein